MLDLLRHFLPAPATVALACPLAAVANVSSAAPWAKRAYVVNRGRVAFGDPEEDEVEQYAQKPSSKYYSVC